MGIYRQFVRYVAIGLASNVVCYVLYIALTRNALGVKPAMSLVYGLGVLQTFVLNKRWSFGHQGTHASVFIRYCVVYGLGYVINLLVLLILVDKLGYPHEIVQGVMIFFLAGLLFLLQKYWVFDSGEFRRLTKQLKATKP